jgi:MFS family permease
MNSQKRNQMVLVLGQLFSGVGVASGIAVGGVLAEKLAGTTAAAGFVQTAAIFGAGLVAIPLSRLAIRKGRRWALSTGFALGALGAVLVLCSAAWEQYWLMMVGMLLFGAATASGLQARYAAADGIEREHQGRAMSIVIWATTVGSVAGPNLSEPGHVFGLELGMEPLSGPYIFSLISFTTAALVVAVFFLGMKSGLAQPETAKPHVSIGAVAALKHAAANPHALFALTGVTGGHMIMVGVMVMTPVHMNHGGYSLELIGMVISLHIMGMYALSPVFGWLVDKIGARQVVLIGGLIFAVAIAIGAVSSDTASPLQMSLALAILGLGWSACLIGGSSLLNQSVPEDIRVPLQGANDMLMNFAAAGMAALAGPILAVGGFLWVNMVALGVLVPMTLLGVRSYLARVPETDPDVSELVEGTSRGR